MFRLILIIMVLFLSCKDYSTKPPKSNIKSLDESINHNRENFDSFFEKFGKDSIFQKHRFRDTINYYFYDDYDKLISKKYSKDNFKFRDYAKDSLAHKNEYNAYEVEKKITKDSIMYYLWGIDNGIHKFYVFRRNNDEKWELNSIHNYSH